MGTNGTDGAAHLMLEEDGIERIDRSRSQVETAGDFRLSALVDKIAFDIARGLVEAVKELDHHIGSETRRLGEAVESGLDSLQIGLRDLSRFTEEQRSRNEAVQEHLQQLDAAVSARFDATLAAVQESDTRHAAEMAAMRADTETSFRSVAERIDQLCSDLGIQREDLAVTKTTLSSRADAVVERLDRHAEAVRSLHAAWSQRETELDQIADSLARLRAYPRPTLTDGL
jgi:DNA anti-recombination protein RmuC